MTLIRDHKRAINDLDIERLCEIRWREQITGGVHLTFCTDNLIKNQVL